jgi:hypothetical protein
MNQRLAFALLFVRCSVSLFGQAQSGTIVGTVSDQGGAVVPGATVTLTNEATQFVRNTVTNASGQYVATSFPTGRITLKVEHPGFQRLVRSGVELTAADTLTVDLQLTVGNVQETVQVTGEAPLLQSQTAAVSNLITNQQILETPLNGRSFTQLLQFSAGAVPQTPGMTTSTSGRGMSANTSVAVNGSVWNNNNYLVDGMFNKDLWINGIVLAPPVDAIQEVRVMTSNYSAEYGAAAGAVTIVQTKSGSNDFHGGLYEFLRNDRLDANNFFNNRAGSAKPKLRRNEFGGTFGGPIRKDKTFFFVDYQGIRLSQGNTTVSTIPTLAQRDMVRTGNFSNLGATVFDPYTVVNGQRVAFAGNQIPLNRIDPVAIKLMSFLPIPTTSGTTRNFTFNPNTNQTADQFDIRGDHALGAGDRLFAKFSHVDYSSLSGGSLPAGPNPVVPIGQYLTGGSKSPMVNWSITLNYTKLIGPSIVNEARAGVVRMAFDTAPLNNDLNIMQALGVPNINLNDRTTSMSGYRIQGSLGFADIGQTGQTPEGNRTTSYQYEDVFTKVKGSHTIKFGGRYLRHQFNGYTAQAPRGVYGFSGTFTRQVNDTTNRPTSLSDFALGTFNALQRAVQNGVFGTRMWESGLFVEDAWRASNRLTLMFGLRHEMQSAPYEVHDRWANFNVSTGELYQANKNGHNRALRSLDDNNFGPRVGVTYMLTRDRKTVLRTGAGIAYVESFNAGKQLHQNPPMTVQQNFVADNNGAPFPFTIKDGISLPVVPNLDVPALLDNNLTGFDMDMKLSKSFQWSFGIQRELMSNLVLDVSYVGSRTLDLINSLNMNQAVPGPGDLQPRRRLRATNPLLQDIDYRTNWGAAKYHSLQVNLQKRYSKGLTGQLAYTWSHNLANARGPSTSVRPQNSYCSACEWGNALEDRRHILVINHVYELPFGSGRSYISKGILSQIVGNWNISGVWAMYSGSYQAPQQSGNGVSNANSTNAFVTAAERPDRVADGNLANGQRSIDRWYDTAAFPVPRQFTYGNSGTGILEGPGYFGVDLGIHRNFQLGEKRRLSYRWEMFNALNRANFNQPTNTLGGTFGQISGTLPARAMQMSLKLYF